MSAPLRVIGTSDPAEIAAVVAALAGRGGEVSMSAYEQWRQRRTAALRASRAR
jgi:hypothetical protein